MSEGTGQQPDTQQPVVQIEKKGFTKSLAVRTLRVEITFDYLYPDYKFAAEMRLESKTEKDKLESDRLLHGWDKDQTNFVRFCRQTELVEGFEDFKGAPGQGYQDALAQYFTGDEMRIFVNGFVGQFEVAILPLQFFRRL